MSTRTTALALLLALIAAAAAPVLGRVVAPPSGPPPPSGLPACRYEDLPAERRGYEQWAETLLDTSYRLPPDYEPLDLLPAELPGTRVLLRAFVVPELRAMLEAAAADGVSITITSGYRSFARQAELFAQVADADGDDHAHRSVARPGHSEHQLGTAVDLKGGAAWLRDNAWRFGFVLSYPDVRSPATTCYIAESWHYRYFGRDRAAAMHGSGLSPREWLWQSRNR